MALNQSAMTVSVTETVGSVANVKQKQNLTAWEGGRESPPILLVVNAGIGNFGKSVEHSTDMCGTALSTLVCLSVFFGY